jgi:dTDP-4-amino-4,6-dideoxygalactose transaminase
MTYDVPLVQVALEDDEIEAYLERLRSGWLTMGPSIKVFEQEMEALLGAPHAVSVSSGSAGLHLAMAACDIGPGDEVVVPAASFVAAAGAVRHVGATPVFADSEAPSAPWIDVDQVERLLTPSTKAVVAVHLLGYPAAVERLRALCDERGLLLVEDCLEAFGATLEATGRHVGTIGDVGVFSLSARAQLPVGEGGVVVCRDEARAARVRSLRSHAMTTVTWDRHRGHHAGYDIVGLGFNFRLDEPRAALGGAQLRRFPQRLEARRAVAEGYASRLAGQPGVELLDCHDAKGGSPSGFVVLVDDADVRSSVRGALERRGIETMRYPLVTQLTAFADAAPAGDRLRAATAFAARHCVLPCRPSLNSATVEWISSELVDALARG